MFDVILMNNSSEKNAFNKNLSTLQTLSGVLKDDTTIINPTIRIQIDISQLNVCNYMYIPTFNRYYYVTDIVSVRNQLVEISGHVDVLMSFQNEILSNTAIVDRQENNWNLYLNDGSFRTYQNPLILTKPFPSGFNAMEFVLAVAG